MKKWRIALALAATAVPAAASAQPAGQAAKLHVDMQYFTLPNGLKVVLSRDQIAPTVTIATYYGIGFRVEPKDRTGFAHLFEHLMFQGSKHAPKGVFDQTVTNSGGINNGSTRFDFTNYYEVLPVERARADAVARGRSHGQSRDRSDRARQPAGRRRQRSEGQCPQPALQHLAVDRSADAGQHQLV